MSQKTIKVNLVFDDNINPPRPPVPEVEVRAPEEATAYEILEIAKSINKCYTAVYKQYSFGRKIIAICDVFENSEEKLFWMIYENGELARYGVDVLKPKHGTQLTFKYTRVGDKCI